SLEKGFRGADVLDGHDRLAGHDVEHAIDHEERITMRQPFLDRLDVERLFFGHLLSSFVFSMSRVSSRSTWANRSAIASSLRKRTAFLRHCMASSAGRCPEY